MKTICRNVFDSFILDACQVNNGGCDSNAACSHSSSDNSVQCICKKGYADNGSGRPGDCKAIAVDPCQVNNGGCDSNAVCSCSADGSVKCICNMGYTDTGSGRKGDCVESCQINNGGCDSNAICSHNGADYCVTCTCKQGYIDAGSGRPGDCKGMHLTMVFRRKKYSFFFY